MRRSDEDLSDFWMMFVTTVGSIEISEDVKDTIQSSLTSATYTTSDGVTRIRPEWVTFTDLCGTETSARLDQIYFFNHNTPEWRETFQRHRALVNISELGWREH